MDFIKTVRKYQSYLRGLLPPEADACGCGYDHSQDWSVFGMKLESPSLYELDLARRSHRWREVNKIMVSFFKAFADQVTRAEEKILQAAGLMELDEVRESFDDESKHPHPRGRWTAKFAEMWAAKQVDPEVLDAIEVIFNIWIENLIGSGTLPDSLENLPIYQYHTFNSFAVGLQKTLEQLEDEIDHPALAQLSYANQYLAKFTRDGMDRIKTKLANEYKPLVQKILEEGFAAGDNPLTIAREIHKRVGEGQLWYWNRLARSESAIALDAAFISEAKANEVEYEEWSAASNACPICAPLDGKIWRLGEGPRVVYDTHPHCLCVKYAYFGQPEAVQPPANQSVPYV